MSKRCVGGQSFWLNRESERNPLIPMGTLFLLVQPSGQMALGRNFHVIKQILPLIDSVFVSRPDEFDQDRLTPRYKCMVHRYAAPNTGVD